MSREHYDNEVKVPDITNMTLEDAKKLLSSRNLRLGPQTEVYSDAAPGTVVQAGKKGLKIACGGETVLEILELQPDGKKRMAASAFLQGRPIPEGSSLL